VSRVARALVIGLDGMPLRLARELAGQGVMPGLRDLLSSGCTAELIAPVPEVSSTSWATFLTGANPGRHGIYGFTELTPGGYDVFFPNLTHVRAPRLWDYLGRAGQRTLSLNVPGTYPAPPIVGAVVSGFVAPDFDRAVNPARVAETLRRAGYQIDVEAGDAVAHPRTFLHRLRSALDARVRAFSDLLAHESWDAAVAVITETDRLQHFLWSQVVDPAAELHEPVMDFYRAVDSAVLTLMRSRTEPTDVYLISDHGFGPATLQFSVNAWLRERGWLSSMDVAPTLGALDDASLVFALDPGRFYLHRADRFPRGPLRPPAAEELTAELCAALRELRWRDGTVGPDVDGPRLLADVYRREDIYRGPLIERAPDVVAVPARGVQLRGAWRPPPAGATSGLTGTHTRSDAMFWTSRTDITAGQTVSFAGAIASSENVDMQSIAPTVLGGLGVYPALDGQDLAVARSVAMADC
jgi:predicted AlkP superfamily phosphohydrolase/phosphomutase